MATLSFTPQGVPTIDGRPAARTFPSGGATVYSFDNIAISVMPVGRGEIDIRFSSVPDDGITLQMDRQGLTNLNQYAADNNRTLTFSRGSRTNGDGRDFVSLVLPSDGVTARDVTVDGEKCLEIADYANLSFMTGVNLRTSFNVQGSHVSLMQIFRDGFDESVSPAVLQERIRSELMRRGLRAENELTPENRQLALIQGANITSSTDQITGNGAIPAAGNTRTLG